MHTYAIGGTKSNIRATVTTIIFVISVIISTLINGGFDLLAGQFPKAFDGINSFLNNWSFLDFSLGNISAFLIFGLLSHLFNSKVWRIPFVYKLLEVPDFTGTWEGELNSSYNDSGTYKIKMVIEQSWNSISIRSYFENSDSGSDSAFIHPEYHLGKMLKFTYANTAKKTNWEQSEHRGQNELFLEDYDTPQKKYMTLRGTYFNNRGKTGNKGTIEMKRVSTKQIRVAEPSSDIPQEEA